MQTLYRIFVFVGLLLALQPVRAEEVPPFPDSCRLVRLAALPITIQNGHVVVDVQLNGQTFHFMVDTGGFVSAISPSAVARLGLQTHPISEEYSVKDAGGGEARRYARIDTITLGTAKLRNLTLMQLQLAAGDDGILAPEILRAFDLDFDFDHGKLNLFKPHRCDDHVVYWTSDFSAIPFTVSDQGHMQFEVRLETKSLRAMLDTGSPYSLIGEQTLKAVLPDRQLTGNRFALRGGSGGQLAATPVTFESLAMGKFLWNTPTLYAASDDSAWKGDGAQLLLGMPEFYGLHAFIAYESRMLYVSRRLPAAAAK